MSPRLSIVIATYNAASTLQQCLSSVARQTFTARELIVVDGGSVDSTVEIVRRNSAHLAYWHSRPDKGIYDAWNQALDRARGEYVCFLGADDMFHSPDTVATIFEAAGEREYDLITGRGRLIDAAGAHEFGKAWNHRKVERRMTICHPGTLHRRDLFERFGRFDTRYKIAADYDFLLRLPADLRTLHLDRVIADLADGGISRDRKWLMLRERYRAQANCPRVGRVRAALNYVDKLWRIPLGKLLRIPS